MFKNIGVLLSVQGGSGFRSKMLAASADVEKFESSVDKTARSIEARANRWQQALGKGMMVAGGLMVAGFALASNAAMQFDKQMSAVQAATQATGGTMSQLRQQALDMGSATAFSATEAAQAQEELAKAGLTSSQILGGALEASLSLAAAAGLDLATSATHVADALTVFNLRAGEAEHVADVLAAGAGKSSTDVNEMGQALAQAGLVANQFGVDIEETTGGLALFASEGLKGSDAGTSLKTALQRLVNPSGEAAELMAELGINVFDAQGNFIGLAGTAEELKTGLAGLTQEQRNQVLATIGGADAVRAMSILFESGASGVNEWTRAVDDSGYAAEQAQKRMDNLAGDVEEFRGALETALIEGGSKATGALRFLVQGATDAINVFSDLPGPVQTALVGIAGVGGAVLILAGGMLTLAPRIQAGIVALEAMGPAGLRAAAGLRAVGSATLTLGKVGLVVGGLLALREVIGTFADEAERADMSKLTNDLLDTAEAGRVVGDEIEAAMDRMRDATGGSGMDAMRNSSQTRQSMQELDDALADLAARDPSAASAAFRAVREELEGMGVPADVVEQSFDAYAAAVEGAETANRTAEGAISDTTAEVDEQGRAISATTEAITGYSDALRAATDPVFGMVDALQSQRDAQSEVRAAEMELAAARESGDPLAIMAAETALSDARLGAVQTAFDLEQAELALAAAVEQNPALIDEVNRKLDDFVSRGVLTTDQAAAMAEQLGIFRETAATVPERIETTADLQDNATSAIEIVAARLLGWDGQTGTADAFLADHASTPLGAVEVELALWNASQGTATADADNESARIRIQAARDQLGAWDRSSGTADVNVRDHATARMNAIMETLRSLDGRTALVTVTHRSIHETVNVGVRPQRMPMRWGGIHEDGIVHAQTGLVQAGIQRSPAIYFAEPETGGEAFVPKNGNPYRSVPVLKEAAGWYGMDIVPQGMRELMAVGGGGTSYDFSATVNMQVRATGNVDGGALEKMLRRAVGSELDNHMRKIRSEAFARGRGR